MHGITKLPSHNRRTVQEILTQAEQDLKDKKLTAALHGVTGALIDLRLTDQEEKLRQDLHEKISRQFLMHFSG